MKKAIISGAQPVNKEQSLQFHPVDQEIWMCASVGYFIYVYKNMSGWKSNFTWVHFI